MHILALEPYYGGSHLAFLNRWFAYSRHRWSVLSLPPHKWKWRMRHAAVTLAEETAALLAEGRHFDRLWASDMLNLAEYLGLAPPAIRAIPSVIYFHENQLTYPVRHEDQRDLHFAFSNFTSALAADAVWFNSAFHRDEFLEATRAYLRRMPDYAPLAAVDQVAAKSTVEPPGVEEFPPRAARPDGPLHILWAARWEHDKDPESFFAAIDQLAGRDIPFRLSVIGQAFRDVPLVFADAAVRHGARIVHWGYQESREDYRRVLSEADVFVSTAAHEFFGLSAVEAIAAGCYPVLPRRLAYPELLDLENHPEAAEFFYDGTVDGLVARLVECSAQLASGELVTRTAVAREQVLRFTWERRAPALDAAIEALGTTTPDAGAS